MSICRPWSAWCWAKPNDSTATSRTCSTRRASAAKEFGRSRGWVDPEDIVNGALVRKRRLLGDRPISLDVADDLPLIDIDATLVESALGQIIENAVKYSAPGTPISIRAAQTGSVIQVKVADKGEGLALGEAEKIFERFYRSPRHAGTIPGSGLGLWIARALIEACGGRVWAISPGHKRGTTFQIDLPVKLSRHPTSTPMSDDTAGRSYHRRRSANSALPACRV